MLSVPQEMRILSREHFNRWYRLAPYYISMLLVEIPFQASCAATYLAVSYWLTGQPVETPRIISFMVVSIAASLTAQAWGFFIGATTPVKVYCTYSFHEPSLHHNNLYFIHFISIMFKAHVIWTVYIQWEQFAPVSCSTQRSVVCANTVARKSEWHRFREAAYMWIQYAVHVWETY